VSGEALLVLDMINEIVHPSGGYPEVCLEEVQRRGVLKQTSMAIKRARQAGIPVIYIVVGFSPGYVDWPETSPLFQEAKVGDRLLLGTWATQVHDSLRPEDHEPVLAKRRISPFFGTDLADMLRDRGVDTLLLTGVTTDLVVMSTARDAHDLDYRVKILVDATASGDLKLHEAALTLLQRTATLTTVEEAIP